VHSGTTVFYVWEYTGRVVRYEPPCARASTGSSVGCPVGEYGSGADWSGFIGSGSRNSVGSSSAGGWLLARREWDPSWQNQAFRYFLSNGAGLHPL
jgi:hypothetical protein